MSETWLRYVTDQGKTLPCRASRYVGVYTGVRARDVQVGDCIPQEGTGDRIPITEIEEVDEQRVSQELRCIDRFV
jgi:hypothetical protein